VEVRETNELQHEFQVRLLMCEASGKENGAFTHTQQKKKKRMLYLPESRLGHLPDKLLLEQKLEGLVCQ